MKLYAPPRPAIADESVDLELHDEQERIAHLARERHVRAVGVLSLAWAVVSSLQWLVLAVHGEFFEVGALFIVALAVGFGLGGRALLRLQRSGALWVAVSSLASLVGDVVSIFSLLTDYRVRAQLPLAVQGAGPYLVAKVVLMALPALYVVGPGATVTTEDHRALVRRTPRILAHPAPWVLGAIGFLVLVVVVAAMILHAAP
jgi:hypothetical protein